MSELLALLGNAIEIGRNARDGANKVVIGFTTQAEALRAQELIADLPRSDHPVDAGAAKDRVNLFAAALRERAFVTALMKAYGPDGSLEEAIAKLRADILLATGRG